MKSNNLDQDLIFKKKYKKPIGNSYPIFFFNFQDVFYVYVFMKKLFKQDGQYIFYTFGGMKFTQLRYETLQFFS